MDSKTWQPFVFGGIASVTAECGTFPIDTTKTRLQVQGQKIDVRLTECRYRGMFHAMFRIFKEEGYLALYSGIAPAILRQATYGTIKIGVYQHLKRVFVPDPKDETLPINVFCGIVAGIISSSIANPTDVLKGVGPTAQRAAIIVGVELPAYDACKKYFLNTGQLGDTKANHFLSSFLAGLAGAIASTPVDVVKTRLMNQRKLKVSVISNGTAIPAIYNSSLDCLLQTVRTEGLQALYKGFIPNWVRLGPWNIIHFRLFLFNWGTVEMLNKIR
ncbi:hypothetical protein ACJMK2_018091 [Sinanodonta woodiana]|uniref:Uncharacterized protein n=1 Tax=Sinanodonta woodiana TaxID=1069815 RepID=A0ABD3UFK4_SINWO